MIKSKRNSPKTHRSNDQIYRGNRRKNSKRKEEIKAAEEKLAELRMKANVPNPNGNDTGWKQC